MKKIIVGGDAVKVYASRDSATAALRKLGIKSQDYAMFVSKTTDGRYACNLEEAHAWLERKSKDKQKRVEITRRVVKAQRGDSVSAVCKKLILDGKSNDEVWKVIKPQFELGDDKKWYPAWNRSALRRAGLLPKELDRGH